MTSRHPYYCSPGGGGTPPSSSGVQQFQYLPAPAAPQGHGTAGWCFSAPRCPSLSISTAQAPPQADVIEGAARRGEGRRGDRKPKPATPAVGPALQNAWAAVGLCQWNLRPPGQGGVWAAVLRCGLPPSGHCLVTPGGGGGLASPGRPPPQHEKNFPPKKHEIYPTPPPRGGGGFSLGDVLEGA